MPMTVAEALWRKRQAMGAGIPPGGVAGALAAPPIVATPGNPQPVPAPVPARPVIDVKSGSGPKSDAVAKALMTSAFNAPKDSGWEVLGGLAQLYSGQRQQDKYLQAQADADAAKKADEQAKLADLANTTDPAELQRKMIEYGIGADKVLEQRLAGPPKPQYEKSGDTILEVQPDGTLKPVYTPPAETPDYRPLMRDEYSTYGIDPNDPRAFQIGKDGKVSITAEPYKTDEPKPYTDVGKIQADLAAGIITEEQAAAAIKKATAGETPYRQLTDPAERAKYGIPPDDTGIYQVNPETNKIEKVGGAGTSVTINGEKLTESQSKDVNFYARGRQADADLSLIDNTLTDLPQSLWSNAPIVGNYQLTADYQQAQRAAREFLAVILRKDTGAAVTPAEFDLYGPMYLPAPGDAPATVEAKRKARARALGAIKIGLGTASKIGDDIDKQIVYPTPAATATAPTPAAPAAPATEFIWTPEGGLQPK